MENLTVMPVPLGDIAQFLGILLGGIVAGSGGFYAITRKSNGNSVSSTITTSNGNGKTKKSKEEFLDKETHSLLCENAFLRFNALIEKRFDTLEDLIRSTH